mmetsp:Transcript_68088/g.121298  ORF Transcript_68088/g.121298 Transcript_68088/m.121298 type:complete len:211 (-) Transcript_68088:1551-2183(-)
MSGMQRTAIMIWRLSISLSPCSFTWRPLQDRLSSRGSSAMNGKRPWQTKQPLGSLRCSPQASLFSTGRRTSRRISRISCARRHSCKRRILLVCRFVGIAATSRQRLMQQLRTSGVRQRSQLGETPLTVCQETIRTKASAAVVIRSCGAWIPSSVLGMCPAQSLRRRSPRRKSTQMSVKCLTASKLQRMSSSSSKHHAKLPWPRSSLTRSR